jgi:WD40-like Beta Propeller Repeat
MKVVGGAAVVFALLEASSCMSTAVLLQVRPDASGHATLTTRLYVSGMRAFDALFAAQGTAPTRPPQLEEELPEPREGQLAMAFGVPVHLVSTRLAKAADGGIRTTEVEFDDVRKLQMVFPPMLATGGSLGMGVSGMSEKPVMAFSIRQHDNGDRLLVVKLPNPSVSSRPDDPVTVFQTDSQEEQLFKAAIKNMSMKLFVETELPLLRTNAPRREGNRATILDLDLDKMINAMDEARVRRMMAPGSFQEMLWQIGDLPGAVIPTETEILLEYQGPPPPQTTPVAPAAQAPPDTEIYLAPLTVANGRITIGTPANITNNKGYDNQPFFTPDGRSILFTSVRGESPGSRDAPLSQTDIYRYDLGTRSIARVTQTPEGEYSPTVMPDGTRISAITVESDGTQRLYSIASSGPKIERVVLLPDVKPVGYHAWADDHTVAVFVLGGNGAPATLQIADTRTRTARIVATDIGRSLQRMPGTGDVRHISFVQRERTGDRVTLVVKELDPGSGTIATLTPAVDGSREADLAWMPDGTLLMAKDDVLYAWRRGQSGWTEVASLSQLSLRGVTRLAISPKGDAIALVGVPPQGR